MKPETAAYIRRAGSGESGKTTVLKQIEIINENGYTKEELLQSADHYVRNIMRISKDAGPGD